MTAVKSAIRAVGKKDAIRDVRKVRNTWRGPKIRNTRGYKIRNTCSRPKIRYTCRMRKYAIRNEGIKWLIQAQAQNIQAQAQNTQYGTREKNAIHDAAKDMQYVPRAKNTHYVPRAKNTQYVKRLKNSVIRAATVKYRIREATIIVRNKYCNTQYLRRQ